MVELLKLIKPKNGILMPFVDTNSLLRTKQPYNFDIKGKCNSESYGQHGFLGTKFGVDIYKCYVWKTDWTLLNDSYLVKRFFFYTIFGGLPLGFSLVTFFLLDNVINLFWPVLILIWALLGACCNIYTVAYSVTKNSLFVCIYLLIFNKCKHTYAAFSFRYNLKK